MKIATLTKAATSRPEAALERALQCARTATDHKAKDVVVLDMHGITPIYDYLVLATGATRRQNHTLAEEIDAVLHAEGERRLCIEGYEVGKWIVQDYGDLVVHIFDQETRSYYSLEELWADATPINWERFA